MGSLYENINALCIEKGIRPSKLCADTGISRGLITDLKMGRKNGITAVTAQKIATYFGVSVGYLLGEGTEKAPALTEKDERDIARSVEKIMDDLANSGDLMFDGVPMSEEAKAAMAAAIRVGLEEAKRRNKETYTPKKYRKE